MDISECLRRAGCEPDLCERASHLARSGRTTELLPQLAEARLALLAELREADGRLACLDQAIHWLRHARATEPTDTKEHA